MNQKLAKILENNINNYEDYAYGTYGSNSAVFEIFNNFFKEFESGLIKDKALEHIAVVADKGITESYDIIDRSRSSEGITFLFKFDKVLYSLNFSSWYENNEMKYRIELNNTTEVKYDADYIYKYMFYSALEVSKLKGSNFKMPAEKFTWEITTPENRTFDDIHLPELIMKDLHFYVNIFDAQGKLLRYLGVGNPGVGKTEATIAISKILNDKGVTIIKTPICEKLEEKVELAKILSPSIIILDDVDLSLGSRNSGGYSRLLGYFLDVMDGTNKLPADVGVIATTNAAHLLDIAAQRPGRFHKILVFDDITKENIKDIILKSFKMNFGIDKKSDNPEHIDLMKAFLAGNMVDKFYDAGVTGSFIYNFVEMNVMSSQTNGEKLTDAELVKKLDHDLAILKKVKKQSYLEDNIGREKEGGSIGFNSGSIKEQSKGWWEDDDDEEIIPPVKKK